MRFAFSPNDLREVVAERENITFMVVVSERAWGLSSQCRPTLAPSRLSAEDVVSRSERIFQDAIPTRYVSKN